MLVNLSRTRKLIRQVVGDTAGALSLSVLVIIVAGAALAPILAPTSPDLLDLRTRFVPPMGRVGDRLVLLGTDNLGRDLLTRVLYGGRTSLSVSLLAVAVASVLGTAAGLRAGYRSGIASGVLMLLMNTGQAFPFIVFAVTMVVVFRPGFFTLLGTLVLWGWVRFARVARAEVLSVRQKEYVEAAVAIGACDRRILFNHILPNILASLIVIATVSFGELVVVEGTLSFLGLGIQPPNVSWGTMISEGQANIFSAWWIGAVPGLLLTLVVVATNTLGDLFQDILDPRIVFMKRRSRVASW